ncbi:hypothetical protein WEI85_31460 [Actinomycetes bacterium KLBMP 9797]
MIGLAGDGADYVRVRSMLRTSPRRRPGPVVKPIRLPEAINGEER